MLRRWLEIVGAVSFTLFAACGGLTVVDGGADAMTVDGGPDGSPNDASDDVADANPGCEPVIEWWMRSGPSSAQPCYSCLSTAEGTQPCASAQPPYTACKFFNDCVNNDCVHGDSSVCDCMQVCAEMEDASGCKVALDDYLLCLYRACVTSCP